MFPPMGKATEQDRLFVVCDGMGGHEHGEIASSVVCEAIGRWFGDNTSEQTPFTDDMLRQAIAYAYTELDQHDTQSFKKMGTTLTLLYLHNNGITAAHIGDSRIYHIRPTEGLKYVSRDHSIAYELFQAGEITYEEMLVYPNKNSITKVMMPGEERRDRPDIIHITDVQAGDYFMLCSDGIIEQMNLSDVRELFATYAGRDQELCEQLAKATADNRDNHTAYIIRVKDVNLTGHADTLTNEEPTARCNQLNFVPPKYH